jgi:hypothetical protein
MKEPDAEPRPGQLRLVPGFDYPDFGLVARE